MSAPAAQIVETAVAAVAGGDLAAVLVQEFNELVQAFQLGKWRPSELSGGRFSEAAFRVCQMVCVGAATPRGKTLPKVDTLLGQLASSSADDSYRLHIPRTLRLIYDLRNKRDVAHLGSGTVSPNLTDATLVLSCASWVMAEIVRLAHQCDIATAQSIVDSLVQRRIPLLWQDGATIRVLDPQLTAREKVLLVLNHVQPEAMSDAALCVAVEYSNASAFRNKVLRSMHRSAEVHYADGLVRILPPGMAAADALVVASRSD